MSLRKALDDLIDKKSLVTTRSKKFVELPIAQRPQYAKEEEEPRKKIIKRTKPSASSEVLSVDGEDEYALPNGKQKRARVKTILPAEDDEIAETLQLSLIEAAQVVPEEEEDDFQFVVPDNFVETFIHTFPNDNDDDDDRITAEEKAARIVVFDKEVDQKESAFEGVAVDFERRSHLKKMEKGATELGSLMASLFFCTEGYDEFIVKFDELMLNKTLVCFKANVRSATIFAAQGQNVWKCKPLDGKKAAKCFLCGYHRIACRNCLFTTKDDCPIGYLGDECAIRWKLVERVFALRKEILSKMGCCDNKAVKIYETKIAKLNEICIRTLRELHNKWAQTDENRIED